MAAAVVFGLAVGNHSLTLLLAPAIGLYVLAVEPSILRRPRFVGACALALLATVVLVFLELPLRAGPFRAPLVYGHPETWDGFWYIVLAEQFRGSLVAPFSDLPMKFASLVDRTVAGFGPLAALIPVGLVATIQLRPRYALLSGVVGGGDLLLRGVVRERRHRSLLPRPGAHRLDLAGDPGRGRRQDGQRRRRSGPRPDDPDVARC